MVKGKHVEKPGLKQLSDPSSVGNTFPRKWRVNSHMFKLISFWSSVFNINVTEQLPETNVCLLFLGRNLEQNFSIECFI